MTGRGTDLFHRTITFDYSDDDRRALMERVWSVTPWMVDAYTGGVDNERCREMVDWCREHFGDEAWPIHKRPGSWQRGGATVFGWTWFGFDDPDKLARFEAAWPSPTLPQEPKGEGK